MAGFTNAMHDLNSLDYEQRYYGEVFALYRLGVEFNGNDAQIQQWIRDRQLPQAFVIDAYDATKNQILKVKRDNRVQARLRNRESKPRFDVRARAATKDPNDIAQALQEFQQLDATWGNHIQCQ